MRRLQRITALLLCIIMMFPTQAMPVLAETLSAETSMEGFVDDDESDYIETSPEKDAEEHYDEVLPLEEQTEEEIDRISETLPLEELTEEETDRISQTLPLEELTEEDTDRISETLPLEELTEEETTHISETLPLETLDGSGTLVTETLVFEEDYEDGVIYWNPGGTLPEELEADSDVSIATDSDAEKASPSVARRGSDSASGFSEKAPVKSLKAALKRAEQLQEEGFDPSEITIYAMNPMEIADGQLYVLNSAGVHITSWPERPYDNDAIFYVNGGQLTIMNISLESGNPEQDAELSELIYIKGGTLQIGENVSINGRIVMDYRNESESELQDMIVEANKTETTSDQTDDTRTSAKQDIMEVDEVPTSKEMAEATEETVLASVETIDDTDKTAASTESGENSLAQSETETTEADVYKEEGLSVRVRKTDSDIEGIAFFDINNYTIEVEEDTIQFIKDTKTASTWREPLIELLEGFDGSGESYLLDVRGDTTTKQVELVKTLYADEVTEEEFLELFQLVETEYEIWNLAASSQAEAQVRDTDSEIAFFAISADEEDWAEEEADSVEVMTKKTLIATKEETGEIIYWNPGGELLGGANNGGANAGSDGSDGSKEHAPVKTWEEAVKNAKNGTIICMQSINLGDPKASDYIKKMEDGKYVVRSGTDGARVTLRPWGKNTQPAFIVPANATLEIEDVILGGLLKESTVADSAMVDCQQGDIIINKNVKAETGFISMETFPEIEDHPMTVSSLYEANDNDKITVFFKGINDNLTYRYKDVVVPEATLVTQGKEDEIGKLLVARFQLHNSNKSGFFDWTLRQDTDEDNTEAKPQNLELYTKHYYREIYLDGVRGNDDYSGALCEFPVKTWEAAMEIRDQAIIDATAARAEATDLTPEQLDSKYPYPEIIYICGTVKVENEESGIETWDLSDVEVEVAGEKMTVKTEVVSHTNIPNVEDTTVQLHDLPTPLISVETGKKLTLRDVTIRNITDVIDSDTIQVIGGGELTLTGNTTLTGERFADGTITAKPTTYGRHVNISGGSTFLMNEEWKGSIEKRQQGVVAKGQGTNVSMYNGSIKENVSFDEALYKENLTTQLNGAGVILSGGASFIMNGGAITKNSVYQYGAGVYMGDTTDQGTTFIMKKGTISHNRIAEDRPSISSGSYLLGQGAGIYAKYGKLHLGDEYSQERVSISENKSYYVYGAGIFAKECELKINNADICNNESVSSYNKYSNYNRGIGIYIENEKSSSLFSMNNVNVSGNKAPPTNEGGTYGAGIYFSNYRNKSSVATITNCKISDNMSGGEYGSTYPTRGGGIYQWGDLIIEGTEISGNRALEGGGIYLEGTNAYTSTLTLSGNSTVKSNTAQGYAFSAIGDGGGIYVSMFNIMHLKSGTIIGGEKEGNFARQKGGGIYNNGKVYIDDSVISYNKSTSGGGIYGLNGDGYLRGTKISNNEANIGGGMYLHSDKNFRKSTRTYYLTDLTIQDNTSNTSGGGIFVQGSTEIIDGNLSFYTTSLYLTESDYGKFVLKNNTARMGGGIYASGSPVYMDISGDIQNKASSQGNNLYLTHSGNWILSGNFLQPTDKSRAGIYNIYMNTTSSESSHSLYIDPTRVTVEKKNVEDNEDTPDVIYLETANSFLTYLQKPNKADKTFPIDVHKDNFKVGSIVIKPANLEESIEFHKVKIGAEGKLETEAYYKEYTTQYKNAGEGIEYSDGGKLPRRTQLGGFKDNAILIGEGIYLSGSGDDNKSGDSPENAVATFKVAKENLQKKIAAKGPEGFSPFIYICGTVNVKDQESWSLEYNEKEFSSEDGGDNVNYRKSEEDAKSPVYEAQIRRFASFVDSPMIVVGEEETNNAVDFELGKIIINGMMEAVVANEQGNNSPILKIEKNASATLGGNTRLTNNYYGAVDVYGSLTLDGGKDDENKQLYNIDGYYVSLGESAKLEMKGYSRIIAEGIVQRRGDRDLVGIYSEANNAEVTMSGHSGIVNKFTINSYNEPDNANLLNAGIYLVGENSKVTMTGASFMDNLDSSFGIQYNIVKTEEGSTRAVGIWVGKRGEVLLEGPDEGWENVGFPKMTNIADGVAIAAGLSSKVTIDNCKIGSEYVHGGVYLDNRSSSDDEILQMRLLNNATIKKAFYGIYADGKNLDIQMQHASKIEESLICGLYLWPSSGGSFKMNEEGRGSCQITGDSEGIRVGTSNKMEIFMGEGSSIRGTNFNNGITFQNKGIVGEGVTLNMTDSQITGFVRGIYFEDSKTPTYITMNGESAIDGNEYGIFEKLGSSFGSAYMELTMNGNSRISGNGIDGIHLEGKMNLLPQGSNGHKIILNNHSVIGGSGLYKNDDLKSGNKTFGIYAACPIQLEMNGDSKITGNKEAVRMENHTTTRNQTGLITLSDNASISKNVKNIEIDSDSYNPLSCNILLQGEARVEDNTNEIVMKGANNSIELKDNAYIGVGTESKERLALFTSGALILDGNSIIDGVTHLAGIAPITMTAKVPDGSDKKYELWLNEGYLGQTVVQPNAPKGRPEDGLQDVTDQLEYFTKIIKEDMTKDRLLIASAPNIVLQAGNNVYLSGDGDDITNNGLSPTTPVRTFNKAKELLQEKDFTTGANIIICNSPVTVLKEDADWSFENGTVTNKTNKVTWTPLVIRNKGYNGQLISVGVAKSEKYAPVVTFKDITIDGGSQEGMVSNTADDFELLKISKGKAILGEKAVLQNNENKINSSTISRNSGYTAAGVVMEDNGILEIDGGTIRNMVRTVSDYIGNVGFASAISMKDNSTLTFKSGLIANNEFNCLSSPSEDARIGTIYMGWGDDENTKLVMSGGVIENNKITNSRSSSKAKTGTILTREATVIIEGGIIRNNQTLYGGSAIYYFNFPTSTTTASLIVSGGQISNNTPSASDQKPVGENSPIYIEGKHFQIKGGGGNIKDNIYLSSSEYLVTVSGAIYNNDRLYNIYLNKGAKENQFKKGSAVIQPDANNVTDVTQFLQYFQVHSYPYILDAGRTKDSIGTIEGVMEDKCLILMKAVYLDSVNGKDSNNGTTPDDAVATFDQAVTCGKKGDGSENHFIIYLSGPAINDEEAKWMLPIPAYMCRYTGFPVYKDNSDIMLYGNAYHGVLIKPKANLTLENISIFGRRIIDAEYSSNGESIIRISSGKIVNLNTGTLLQRNNNTGAYLDADNKLVNLTQKGGAVYVEGGGELNVYGGTIQNTSAIDGSAIYLDVNQTAGTAGQLFLTGSPIISGKTYLNGKENAEAYVVTESAFKPASKIQVSVANDYSGRKVIEYKDAEPGYEQMKLFAFDDVIVAIYDIVNNSEKPKTIELLIRKAIYLDGQNGKDDNIYNDGTTPDRAFKTLKKVYETIGKDEDRKGILVYIVDTVDVKINDDIALNNMEILENNKSYYKGSYTDTKENGTTIEIIGQVFFKRYSQPNSATQIEGFGKGSLKETLFNVEDGGKLTLNGIYVDGHSQASQGSDVSLAADGVEAESPLITVKGGGKLTCSTSVFEIGSKAVSKNTILANNYNINDKFEQEGKYIGELNNKNQYEGSSAGIEVLASKSGDKEKMGTVYLSTTEFRNLQLKEGIIGGTDIYVNGELHTKNGTLLTGTVFLEGLGTREDEASRETSRYITADKYGTPVNGNFQIFMRDPYLCRPVVWYLEGIPIIKDTAMFLLEEQVKDYFCLVNRVGAENILELNVPVAVYIDGTNGRDKQGGIYGEDRIAGSNPKNPVKTLSRAYDLLRTRGGNTIYVVDTILIDGNTTATGSYYSDDSGAPPTYFFATDKVRITRYIQPKFATEAVTAEEKQDVADRGYDVKDFTGVMLNVKNGGVAKFSEGIIFDGHHETKTGLEYREEAIVERTSESMAPMIAVDSGGVLELQEETILQDNYNAYTESEAEATGTHGGALSNSGTTVTDGALFTNNKAEKGSAVYQNGLFTIQSKPEKFIDGSFYLTTTEGGTDHVIRLNEKMLEEPEHLVYDIDMDNPVVGRDVIEFISESAYEDSADAEHDHFRLSDNVPENLFLVEDLFNPNVLELQDWKVLNVEVPSDIYLVFQQRGQLGSGHLKGIRLEAEADTLLSSPEYTITNNGFYDVKVSATAFENVNSDAEIPGIYSMNLVNTEYDTIGENDLYLAVQGVNRFSFDETTLAPYAEAEENRPAAIEFGTLNPMGTGTESGTFTFLGSVGQGFMDKYKDKNFPIEGMSKTEVQKYIDGTSGSGAAINARSKYAMKFKLEIDPPRRINEVDTNP